MKESHSENNKIIVHCSFGIGRAGLTAACLIRKLALLKDYEEIKTFLRKNRNVNCIESRNQEEFVKKYLEYLESLE